MEAVVVGEIFGAPSDREIWRRFICLNKHYGL